MSEKTIHQGRNIKRFREMPGIKQEGLAPKLGDDQSQKKISLPEKETIALALPELCLNLLYPSNGRCNMNGSIGY